VDFIQLARQELEFARLMVVNRREQGMEVQEAEARVKEAKHLLTLEAPNPALRLLAEARGLLRNPPMRSDFPYEEPSSWEEINAAFRPAQARKYDFADYDDKTLGGWLGKNIGGALGGPVEGWSRERIAAEYGEVIGFLAPPSTLNDDTAYEVLLLHALQMWGLDATSAQIAREWVEHLPKAYTAERVALENIRRGLTPPETATTDDPYSEWIGGQMKGEICGWLAPGNPDLAAELAYRDGIIAHEKNGVYGEIYNAVTCSLAYVESEVRKILEMGLGYVPPKSRFAEIVRQTLAWCDASGDWLGAWLEVEKTYAREYDPVHTLSNIPAVIIGLVYGGGDFGRTACITTMCGLDTDCTAGQAAALVGTVLGAKGIPFGWKDAVGDDFETFVIGYEHLKTSEIAARTCLYGRAFADRS